MLSSKFHLKNIININILFSSSLYAGNDTIIKTTTRPKQGEQQQQQQSEESKEQNGVFSRYLEKALYNTFFLEILVPVQQIYRNVPTA